MSTEAASLPDPNEHSEYWAISRFKGKTDRGSVYPLRIKWHRPITRSEVLLYCALRAAARDKDFRPFKHFTCHPVTK